MVPTLEATKGGGGSVRIGTTGTIGSLVTRELESLKHDPHISAPSRRKSQAEPVSVPCGSTTPKKSQPRKNSLNEASSSSSKGVNCRGPGNTQKPRPNIGKNGHRIPMLSADDISMERNPNRPKLEKKGSLIVEVVDIKCGNSDKAWSSPITNRLKKLGFSKLSETIN